MHVKAIEAAGIFKHAGSRVELPPEGIVVVTGENGAGKSGLFVEAVPLAIWGRTLRGEGHRGFDPWGSEGSIMVEFDGGLRVERTRRKGKTDLRWSVNGDGERFETATKAQEALEAVVGSFALWANGASFSSADASAFMLAPDAERKRLLEEIIGGSVNFDAALRACRADLDAADLEVSRARREVEQIDAGIVRLDAEIARAREGLARFNAEAPAAVALPKGKSADELAGLARAAEADMARARDRARVIERAGGEASAMARQIGDTLRRLEGTAACPTCGQVVGPDLLEALRRSVSKLAAQAEAERKATEAERQAIAAELSELEDERAALVRRRDERAAVELAARARADERARWADARDRMAATLATVEAEREKVGSGRDDWLERASKAEIGQLTLRAVEAVLGVRGVRSAVLGRALGGVESIANGWLDRLGIEGLHLRLRPYTEKKTGGTSESISAEVLGAGGGSYYGASSGERRRIDVALVLALAEVAGAARGRRPGTMFFDEVFDAVSAAGLPAVVRVVREFARGRCVVVVTHKADLARDIPAAARYHVEAGKVARVS
jgi:DNA repair exonuclease SbcCD ATPase subunit